MLNLNSKKISRLWYLYSRNWISFMYRLSLILKFSDMKTNILFMNDNQILFYQNEMKWNEMKLNIYHSITFKTQKSFILKY
jgi:hypothetical protein